ncbi:hypothetical protein BDZ94DRAFT_1376575 [Collybia nuda]|uniref:DUF2855 family protein n=1 Tax=Collybia nuda TaxID=64659 RepID=A0A9P5YHC4_9AGAR|nr:hypothetical protein BDZ94DRAFT_1376575 [Collybia nuda]
MDANVTLCLPRVSSGQDPHKPVIISSPKPKDCPPNHVLIKVDRFGFSANNITYQALGEHPHFRYFEFNPAPENGSVSPKSHGLIPVWGFGTIVTSTHPKINEGERVYGYFAPTRYLLVPVSPSDVNKHAFYVPRPHLPPDRRPYNQILRCATDPHYTPTPTAEDLTMLYRPLFWTSYWCEDWLFSTGYRGGVSSFLISSASSKTAFCLAYLIQKRIARGDVNAHTTVIGLTSTKNLAFTKGLGLYHEVYEYDTFSSAPLLQGQDKRWIYVDVAGNEGLNQQITSHLSSPYTGSLAACVSLGLTNLTPSSNADSLDWNANTFTTPTPPSTNDVVATSSFWPKFENFFMVEWLDVRKHQISIAEIFSRQNLAWKQLMVDCVGWVKIDRIYGANDVKEAYEKVAKYGLGPAHGLVWSMWDKGDALVAKL